MRRRLLVVLAAVTFGSTMAGVCPDALAARPATLEETAAIAQEVGFPDGCLSAEVSTAVPDWAVAKPTNSDGCPGADGQVLLQGAGASWTQVTAGSDFGFCPIDGVPAVVSAEFALCRVATAADTVLGAAEFAPNGDGFGERRPRRVFNGGVPSGLIRKIRWRHWGAKTATGRGKTYLYTPEGGYYARMGAIELRVSRKGRCQSDGPPAYRRLQARVAKRPGGKLGRWFDWAGAKTICSF